MDTIQLVQIMEHIISTVGVAEVKEEEAEIKVEQVEMEVVVEVMVVVVVEVVVVVMIQFARPAPGAHVIACSRFSIFYVV